MVWSDLVSGVKDAWKEAVDATSASPSSSSRSRDHKSFKAERSKSQTADKFGNKHNKIEPKHSLSSNEPVNNQLMFLRNSKTIVNKKNSTTIPHIPFKLNRKSGPSTIKSSLKMPGSFPGFFITPLERPRKRDLSEKEYVEITASGKKRRITKPKVNVPMVQKSKSYSETNKTDNNINKKQQGSSLTSTLWRSFVDGITSNKEDEFGMENNAELKQLGHAKLNTNDVNKTRAEIYMKFSKGSLVSDADAQVKDLEIKEEDNTINIFKGNEKEHKSENDMNKKKSNTRSQQLGSKKEKDKKYRHKVKKTNLETSNELETRNVNKSSMTSSSSATLVSKKKSKTVSDIASDHDHEDESRELRKRVENLEQQLSTVITELQEEKERSMMLERSIMSGFTYYDVALANNPHNEIGKANEHNFSTILPDVEDGYATNNVIHDVQQNNGSNEEFTYDPEHDHNYNYNSSGLREDLNSEQPPIHKYTDRENDLLTAADAGNISPLNDIPAASSSPSAIVAVKQEEDTNYDLLVEGGLGLSPVQIDFDKFH